MTTPTPTPTPDTRQFCNVLVLSTEDDGPDEVQLFEAGDDEAADGKALAEYAESRGYRGENDDYWVFLGVHIADAAQLATRPKAGRFAVPGRVEAERRAVKEQLAAGGGHR